MVADDSSFRASVRLSKNTSRITARTAVAMPNNRRFSEPRALRLALRLLFKAKTAPTATILARIAPRPLVSHKAIAISKVQVPNSQILAGDRGSRIEVREWRIDGADADDPPSSIFDPRSSIFDPPSSILELRSSFHRRRAAKVKPTAAGNNSARKPAKELGWANVENTALDWTL